MSRMQETPTSDSAALTPPFQSRGFFADIWSYRFALHNLILTDFRIRYRNMSLGIVWSILNPLIMLGVLVIVFSYIHPQRQQYHFPIFLLLGLIGFNFFSLCVTAATSCIVMNYSLVKKVIFPRQILPAAAVLSQVIHLLIQLALLAFFILLFRVPLAWTALWIIPIYLVELVYISGFSLIAAAANVYYRDAQYLVQSLMTVLFWFTPIFYSLATVKTNLPRPLYLAYLLNPIAGCIEASRNAILGRTVPDVEALGIAAIVAVVVFIAGVRFFLRVERNFADKV